MKIWSRTVCALAVFAMAAAALADNTPGKYMDPKLWEATANPGSLPGKISVIDAPSGKGIRTTVVQDSEYQGLRITLPEPVDLSKLGAITFDFEQNGYGGDGNMAFMLQTVAGGGLIATPLFSASGWRHVTIPVNTQTIQGIGQSSAALGPVKQITITLYNNLDKKDEHISIANLVFHDKKAGDQPLPVMGYKYNAAPTKGDSDRTWLTNGKISDAEQAYYREYSDDPDIQFDLGSICRISKFTLSAIAVPSQNASAVELFTSFDGKKWTLAKHLPATNNGTEKKQYAIGADGLALYGRFVRVKVLRNRTDFQVRIAEIAFEGRQPTQEELAAAAEEHYELGPAMPELTATDYYQVKGPAGESLWINRHNGVAVAYEKGGKRLAERIFMRYELSDGKNPVKGNAYQDRVTSVKSEAGKIRFITENPAIPGVQFLHAFSWVDGSLAIGLTCRSTRTDKKILFTATEVVLPKELRRHGLYETWGAGHDMQHKFADELTLELPADTGPVVVFEQPDLPMTLLHCRYKYNDRYIQIGSGTVTVAGFGDKRTIFTPTGWVIGDGLFALTSPNTKGYTETRLLVAPGDLTAANDAYLALPEVKEFRSQIHRPNYLKDVRFFYNGPGWDAAWGNNLLRSFEYSSAMIREGNFQASCDYVGFPWGNFSTGEYASIMRGGKRKVDGVVASIDEMHAKTRVKFAMYTWLWSVLHNSPIYKEHPEWFVTYNADGKLSSFFPGWATNFYRLIHIPEHRERVVNEILNVEKVYKCDTWYLDGGGSPSCIDWPTMRIDEPDSWDQTLLEIRTKLQERNPEHGVFFNHPENPLGDFGYLESFGGVLTTNWRDGATWMYKFKLWQRNDPLRSPLYIYWLGGVDTAMRQYAIGTGLGLTFSTNNLRPEVSYMGAQQQSRWGKLVNAQLKPNWRYEPEETLEAMPLTRGTGAWVFLRSHSEKPETKNVSVDAAAMGLKDASRPVYCWSMAIKPHSRHKGLLTEGEREADYRASRWQSDFVVTTRFLGTVPYAKRMERNFTLGKDEAMLWGMTQSPAVVYSVDGMRNQLWLPDTMGVSVSGYTTDSAILLTVNSERKEAEIASILPKGKSVKSVTVNGAAVQTDTIVLDGTPLAVIPVKQGKNNVLITLAGVKPVNGNVKLSVSAGLPGGTLKLKISAPAQAELTGTIYFNDDLVWSGAVQNGTSKIGIPTGVTGGAYLAVLYDRSGAKLAEKKFHINAGTPKYPEFQAAEAVPDKRAQEALVQAVDGRGFKLLGTAKAESEDCGSIQFDPANAKITLTTADWPRSRWFIMAGAYEMEAKRYLKIRLDGNFGEHNREDDIIGIDGLGTNYDLPFVCFALNFDFGSGSKEAGSYTSRTISGLGLVWENRNNSEPSNWGTGKTANVINILSNFGAETKDSEELWIDLVDVGAPEDWNGMLMFGPIYQCGSPARQLNVTVLESSDELPAGAQLKKAHPLKDQRVKVEQKVVKPPVVRTAPTIDGKADEVEWQTAPSFTTLTMLNSPTVNAPETEFKVLRDRNCLYVLATLTQPEGSFFTEAGQDPWFCDNIEVWLGRRNGKEGEIQYIFATNGKTYAKRRDTSGAGAPAADLAVPEHKCVISGGKAVFELAIPLKDLGTGADVSGFNFCRAVRKDGNVAGYTLAPGRSYRNFDYYAFDWR